MSASTNESRRDNVGNVRSSLLGSQSSGKTVASPSGGDSRRQGPILRELGSVRDGPRKVAVVEGAVDTLALRALRPSFAVLGIPGICNWRPSWARLVADADVRYALDRGKPRKSDGVISEDEACARIALDVAQAVWQMFGSCQGSSELLHHKPGDFGKQVVLGPDTASLTAEYQNVEASRNGGKALDKSGAFAFPFTDLTLEWMLSRHRRGKALFCVLCGAAEPWLCRDCGRRRAPVGMDWGKVWESVR